MNGNNGIVPTVDLATNNSYPYPVFYGNNGYGNNGYGQGQSNNYGQQQPAGFDPYTGKPIYR